MLDLNYYFIDVGINSCIIKKKGVLLSVYSAIRNHDDMELTLIKEHILCAMRKKAPFLTESSFKIVLVNKKGKLAIATDVVDPMNNQSIAGCCVASNPSYDMYIIRAGQRLDIRYQIISDEIENRTMYYEDITVKKIRR